MTFGSEFTFHKALGERKPAAMHLQLKHTGKWETLVTIQPHMVEKVKRYLSAGNEGKTWRFVKPSAPRKRAAKSATEESAK